MPVRKFVYFNTIEEDFADQDQSADSLQLPALDMQVEITMNWNQINTVGAAFASGDTLAYGQFEAELGGLNVTADITMSGNEVTGASFIPVSW
jgi:hypothetical protein